MRRKSDCVCVYKAHDEKYFGKGCSVSPTVILYAGRFTPTAHETGCGLLIKLP